MTDTLMAAAATVDVIDLAGRIIAHPRYQSTMTPAAGVVALAHAVEKFWAIAVEAEVLARAIARLPTATETERALRDAAIERQTETILTLMAALRGDTQETSDERT